MNSKEIKKLKQKALIATPGPWQVGECYADNGAGTASTIYNANGVDVFSEDGISEPDADFIAAANPAAVLELIAGVEYRTGKAREHFDACMGCDEALKAVTAQRDELLAALRGMVQLDRENHQRGDDDIDVAKEVQDAYNAIAKAEGSL